jgi:hypothetical protein
MHRSKLLLAAVSGLIVVIGLGASTDGHAQIADARVVFVHAAPVGTANTGAAFRLDEGSATTLMPHGRSDEIAVAAGNRTIVVDIPAAAPLSVTHRFVADQTHVVLLAGDGIRQPYTLAVEPTPSVVPRRGLAVVTIRETATLPGLLPSPDTAARYDRFVSCDGVLQRSPASFGQAADFIYFQPVDAPARCRAGLMQRGSATVVSEVAFEGRSGQRRLVYGTGNGIEAPVGHHLVDLGFVPEAMPRPMGPDMEGLWASRTISGELLVVQQAADATTLSGVYAGFDASGRPVWSAVRSRIPPYPHEYPLDVQLPVDGDPSGRRPFAGITVHGGTLLFLSCTEAVVEYVTNPLPPNQFFSTRGTRLFDGVRLWRLTAPNGCVDP